MKCKICEQEGRESYLFDRGMTSTLLTASQFYTSEGVQHFHDPNKYVTTYECSQGHQYKRTHYQKCPCGYVRGIEHFDLET